MGTFCQEHTSIIRCNLVNLFPVPIFGRFPNESTTEGPSKCVNVSQSTLVKLVYKPVTPVGNYTALSMESSRMVKCQATRPLEVEMTPSTPSSVKLELENTFQERFLLIWNQPLLMRSVPEPTVNFSIRNSW